MSRTTSTKNKGWSDYESGQWAAFSRVLNLLNTYDERDIPKKTLYRDVMGMRPIAKE